MVSLIIPKAVDAKITGQPTLTITRTGSIIRTSSLKNAHPPINIMADTPAYILPIICSMINR